jgi:hypothetical protein
VVTPAPPVRPGVIHGPAPVDQEILLCRPRQWASTRQWAPGWPGPACGRSAR